MQNINIDITQPAFYSYLQRKPAHLEWSLLVYSLLNLNVQVWYFPQAEEKTVKFFLQHIWNLYRLTQLAWLSFKNKQKKARVHSVV